MAITLVTTQTIIARNAGALYGVTVGSTLMTSLVAQASAAGSSTDALLNLVYVQSVGTTPTTSVAATLIANLGITGATAIKQATDYIVATLNANSPSFRGAAVNDLLDLFVGLTNDANFGAAATAYNAKVANAEAYALVAANVSNGNFSTVTSDTTVGTTFTLTTGADTAKGATLIDGSRFLSGGTFVDTLNSSDKITGTAGTTDTLFVQAVTTAATTTTPASITGVEILTVENTGTLAYTLSLANGDALLKTVNVNNSTGGTVSVTNNNAALTTLGLSNVSTAVSVASVASAVAGATDTLALNLSSVTLGQGVTIAGYETVNVTSNGSVANNVGALTDTSLTTLNIAGAQQVTLSSASTNLATVNAATATGKVLFTTTAVSNVAITGGTVDDTITLGATYTTADTINGGLGTDTLVINNAAAIAATTAQTNVTNVEVISLTDTVDGTAISLVNWRATGLQLGTAVSQTSNVLANYAAGTNSFDRQDSTDSANETTTLNIAGVATTDVLNVTLGTSTVASVWNGTGALTINGAETVNVTALFGPTTIGGAVTLTNTAATETLNILGNQSTTITGAVTADTINASTMTGSGALVMTATSLGAGATITGSLGADTLRGTANADIISGGAGNDNIIGMGGLDILTGGAGIDTFRYTVVGQGSNVSTIASATAMTAGDTITDFVSGTGGDLINVNALATAHVAATGAAAAWSVTSTGVYILTGANLDFVAGTTTAANVGTVIGTLTGGAGEVGYIAILDTQSTVSTADDQYNIFEVTTVNARVGAALAGTDTISLVGTITGTALVVGDFTA